MRTLTDAAGAVLHTYQTDEFGVPTISGGRSQPFGFTGEQRDAGTGLVYLRARMYDPTSGRFLQRDPYPGMPTSPSSLHRYTYVENNPVNATAPSGLASGRVFNSSTDDDLNCYDPTNTRRFCIRWHVHPSPWGPLLIPGILKDFGRRDNDIRVSKLASDWETEGAHIHVGRVELKVLPGIGGSIVFKPVFSRDSPRAVQAAIHRANEALNNPAFRRELYQAAGRARQYLGRSESAAATAKSAELHFLMKALEKMGQNESIIRGVFAIWQFRTA